jgi:uncharacterized BrkB/YihY/UPF0761 family membrane protein
MLSAAISTLTRFEFFKEIGRMVYYLDLSFSFCVITFVFSNIFKWIPAAKVSFKAALIGGLLAAF